MRIALTLYALILAGRVQGWFARGQLKAQTHAARRPSLSANGIKGGVSVRRVDAAVRGLRLRMARPPGIPAISARTRPAPRR